MLMLTRRLQVLVDDERYVRLERLAHAQRVSVATLVREAIDAAYPASSPARRRAAQHILSAEPMDVPDIDDLRDELDQLRGSRGRP